MNARHPTAYPELNAVLDEFVTSARAVLGVNFLAAYLGGSFAVGEWDGDSDVDFLIAVEHDVPDAEVPALEAMHARIYHLDSPWAQHLEGSYFPRKIMRHGDPARTPLLFLDNGHEALIRSGHDNKLVVLWVVRECGITLAGADPHTLIDPLPVEGMRQEVLTIMHDWANDIFAHRYVIDNRWAQPYVVLQYCRMLHTLYTGRVESKLAGAEWARSALDRRWAGLIQRAWQERPNPSRKIQQRADPGDLEATLEFTRYALAETHYQPTQYHPYV